MNTNQNLSIGTAVTVPSLSGQRIGEVVYINAHGLYKVRMLTGDMTHYGLAAHLLVKAGA